MRLIRFLPISSLLLLAFTCGKDYTGPAIDFGPGEGITYRDDQGRPNGPQDATDWTSDATWNDQELQRFTLPNATSNGPQLPQAVRATYAFPNPGPANQATWRLRMSPAAPCPCHVYASLVSKRYTEVDTYVADVAAGDSVQHLFKAYNPELYRIYYLVTNAQGLVYKGHGDLRFIH